jgi:hypothetical protein
MRRTAWGLSAMSVSLALGTVIAVGSLIALRGQLDSDALTRQPLSVPTVLVSCLDPLAILFEIAAIVLIVRDGRQFGVGHRRFARAAAGLYVTWAAANLLGFLPLSYLGLRSGSLPVALAGQWVKAVAGLLAYAVPAMLAFGLGGRVPRVGLCLGLLLSAVGSFGTVAMSLCDFQLQPITAAGQIMYVAKLSVDYTTGLYPALLATSYTGGALYLLVYIYLARQAWLRERSASVTRVSAAEGHRG